jgi:hypothetical protein
MMDLISFRFGDGPLQTGPDYNCSLELLVLFNERFVLSQKYMGKDTLVCKVSTENAKPGEIRVGPRELQI